MNRRVSEDAGRGKRFAGETCDRHCNGWTGLVKARRRHAAYAIINSRCMAQLVISPQLCMFVNAPFELKLFCCLFPHVQRLYNLFKGLRIYRTFDRYQI